MFFIVSQGSTEQHQLALITKLCGSITPEVWPSVENYDLFNKMELVKGQQRRVCERLKHYVRDNQVMGCVIGADWHLHDACNFIYSYLIAEEL